MINLITKLRISLDRTVPLEDPNYIFGEEASLNGFKEWMKSVDLGNGFLGAVVLGQIGNGKTHFLRYIRQYYRTNDSLVGIYVPNMFISGPFVDALNGIYSSFFFGPENYSLKTYADKWLQLDKSKVSLNDNNEIFRYLARCNNKQEVEKVLHYFSNAELFPDDHIFLRSKFGAKKKFIVNENDFAKYTADALEFLQVISQNKILFLFDEVDKVYSADTNSECITRVGLRILSAYRVLFDLLNARNLSGLICIGATPDAWDVLSRQAAFDRRFKHNKIILKVPKTHNDCLLFVNQRLQEIGYTPNETDKEQIKNLVYSIDQEKLKTWADVITALRSDQSEKKVLDSKDPVEQILQVLNNSVAALTWSEIIAKSSVLKQLYPNSQPTPLLTKLEKEGKIKAYPTKPKTYESVVISEEFIDD